MKGRWIAPAAFAAMIALFYWPEVSGRTTLYAPDEIANDWGGAREFAEGLLRGELRLWSDRYFAGFPLVAFMRMGPLYPLKLPLFGVFDVVAAVQRTLWLHLLLMALFTHLYVREVGGSRAAGALAGAVYAFNGFAADYYHALHGITTFAWMPAILLCVERWTKRGEARWLAGIAAATGLHWLGGHTQYAYYTSLLLPFYAVCRARAEARRRWAFRAALALAASGVGVGLAAPQILPAVDLKAQSARALIDYAHAVAGGGNNLGAKEILEYLLPLARGGRHAPHFAAGYFGFLTILFALYAAWRARSDAVRFWMFATGAALLLAAGKNTPVFGALYALGLPGFSSFHDPQRAQLVAVFGFATLGGLGLDAFLRQARESRRGLLAGAILAAGLLAAALALQRSVGAAEIGDGTTAASLRAQSAFHLAFFAAASLAVALCGYAAHVRPWAARPGAALLAALAFANLWLVNRPLLPAPERASPAPAPLAAALAATLGDARYFGEGADAWVNNKGAAIGLAHASGEDSLVPLRFLQLTGLRATVDPSHQIAYGDFLASPEALRVLGVRAILAQRAPDRERVWQHPDTGGALYWDDPRLARTRAAYAPLAEADSLRAYADAAPPPRAWCVEEAREAPLAETLEALRAGTVDPARTALLDPGALGGGALRGAPCEADLRSEGHGAWDLRARAEGPMVVVLSDAMLPGLRAAEAGGEPATLLRAFGHVRALALPGGDRRVRIVYDPVSFRLGWFVAVLAATITLHAFVARRGRPGRARPPSAGAR